MGRGRVAFLFFVVPVLNGVSSLVALPAVTAQFGADGWAAVAIGLSLGSAGAIAVEMGWGVDGPVRIARAGARSRASGYVWSVRMKLLVLPLILALAAPIAAIASAEHKWVAAVMAIASAGIGLSPAWFFTGCREPQRLILTDSIPRLVATLIAAAALSLGAPLLTYPVLLGVATFSSPWLGMLSARIRPRQVPHLTIRRQLLLIRIQFKALRGRMAVSAYRSLPVVLVSAVFPSAVPIFAAAERLQKMALQFLNSASLYLSGWVGSQPTFEKRLQRSKRAIQAQAALGIIAGTLFAVLAPFVSRILFSDVATVPPLLSTLAGIVIALGCVARGFTVRLIVLHRVHTYSNAATASGIVGVLTIPALASWLGSVGGMVGEVLAEATSVTYQAARSARRARSQ